MRQPVRHVKNEQNMPSLFRKCLKRIFPHLNTKEICRFMVEMYKINMVTYFKWGIYSV